MDVLDSNAGIAPVGEGVSVADMARSMTGATVDGDRGFTAFKMLGGGHPWMGGGWRADFAAVPGARSRVAAATLVDIDGVPSYVVR